MIFTHEELKKEVETFEELKGQYLYLLDNKTKDKKYIGKTTNLYQRMLKYSQCKSHNVDLEKDLKNGDRFYIYISEVREELDLSKQERNLIERFEKNKRKTYNSMMSVDKPKRRKSVTICGKEYKTIKSVFDEWLSIRETLDVSQVLESDVKQFVYEVSKVKLNLESKSIDDVEFIMGYDFNDYLVPHYESNRVSIKKCIRYLFNN